MSLTGPPRAALVWFSLGIVYVIWGSTYLGIRVVVESLPAFGSAALRFAVAGVVLGAILAARRGIRALRVSLRQLGAAALVGVLLLAGGNGLVVLAESPSFKLPFGYRGAADRAGPAPARGAAPDNRRPPAHDHHRRRPGRARRSGAAVPARRDASRRDAGHGAAGGHAIPVAGGLIVLVAVVCWSVGSFATRWLPMPADPFVASV